MKSRGRILLGLPLPAVGMLIASVLVTAVIIRYQLHLRSDVGDPAGLRIFYHLYLMHDYPAALLGLVVIFVGLSPRLRRLGLSVADMIGERPAQTSALAGIAMAAGSFWAYQAYPLCMDEYAPYLQAKVFAAGRLTGQLPPDLVDWLVVPGFQGSFIHVSHATGAVASAYFPGFALLLTPFSVLGVPWMANPVIGALSLLAIHRLTLEALGSNRAAGAAVLFALASPVLTVNAFSFYSMPAHLLCNVVYALLLVRPTLARTLGAGVVGGLALVLHNPAPHILFAVPWLVWLFMQPGRWMFALGLAIGYAPWLVVALGWHYVLGTLSHPEVAATSLSLVSMVEQLTKSLDGVIGIPGEGILTARVVGLSKVWIWAVPGLVVLAAAGFWRHRTDTRFRLLFASALMTLVGFLFVSFDQGHGWGFRYFHSVWFVLPIFAAGAMVRPGEFRTGLETTAESSAAAYVLAVATIGGVVLTGHYAWRVHSFISNHLDQLPRAESGVPHVVFVNPSLGYYASDLVQNDPFMRGGVLVMLSHGRDRDRQLVQNRFPSLVLLHSDYRGTVWGTLAPPR